MPFLRSTYKCFDCHTGKGRNGACISDLKEKNKKSDSSFFESCRFSPYSSEKTSNCRRASFFQPLYRIQKRFLQRARGIAEIVFGCFFGKSGVALEYMNRIWSKEQLFLSADTVQLIERRNDFCQRDGNIRYGFFYADASGNRFENISDCGIVTGENIAFSAYALFRT